MATPRPSEAQVRLNPGFDLAVSSGLEAAVWKNGRKALIAKRGKEICSEEVKPEGTTRPLKHQKFISALQRPGPANKKRLEHSP